MDGTVLDETVFDETVFDERVRDETVLGELAALGPFFAVASHEPGAPAVAPWRRASELAAPGGALRERIAAVRAALAAQPGGRSRPAGAIDPRVAASVTHLGLAARLIAPALGAAVIGHDLDLRLDVLWWQDTLGGPVPLSVPVPVPADAPPAAPVSPGTPPAAPALAGAVPRADPGRDAASVAHRFLDEVIAPLTRATRELVPVSSRVLWGNVASGVNSAARQAAASRPDRAWRVAGDWFASPLLAGERQPPGPDFRRSSCCLIYKVAPGGPAAVCGDCVLNARPVRGRRPRGWEPS
jgi:FhuF-like iron-sulfur protein